MFTGKFASGVNHQKHNYIIQITEESHHTHELGVILTFLIAGLAVLPIWNCVVINLMSLLN